MFFIAFIVIFVSTFGLTAFESFFSLYVDHKFAFSPLDIAISITGGAIIGAICQVVPFKQRENVYILGCSVSFLFIF